MARKILSSVFFFISISISAQSHLNIKDFGAKGDGNHLDHTAINAAIDSCVSLGGGEIEIPAGNYLCGNIRLKSNVNLHLSAGSKIIAAPESMKAYDQAETFEGTAYQDGGHTYFKNSLIWAIDQHDISITGSGMIDGIGLTKKDTEHSGIVEGGNIGTGDKAIALKNCKGVLIRDITIFRGGHFGIIMTGCERGTIDNVTIDTNRDGIDIDACSWINITNTKVNTPHDDAIVLKSSYALKRVKPCEHILVTGCLVTGYKLGTFLDGTYIPETVNWVCGRIKLGTESNGGYRDIAISNCTAMWSSGLAFEEVDQGTMENVVVNNITMEHVHHYPIYITTGCRNRGPQERKDISSARNIMISNVIATDVDSLAGIIITGMPGHKIQNVFLNHIYIQSRGGCNNTFENTTYPELGTKYPEPTFSGATPAYGLFARHVDGLYLSNIHFDTLRKDVRKPIWLEDVNRIETEMVPTFSEAYQRK